MSPQKLFNRLAVTEAFTWALLLFGMFLKYVTETTELLVRIGGGVHGFVFLAFVVVTVLIAVDQKWKLSDLALGLVSAVFPFATVPFERWAESRDKVTQTWRLATAAPTTSPEKAVATAVRRPLAAGLIIVVAVSVLFVVLVIVGPPGS